MFIILQQARDRNYICELSRNKREVERIIADIKSKIESAPEVKLRVVPRPPSAGRLIDLMTRLIHPDRVRAVNAA